MISLTEARQLLEIVATENNKIFAQDEEVLPLHQVVGRTLKSDIKSPISTPTFDTAALDGYAVIGHQTLHATTQTPVLLRVMGKIKPGSPPLVVDDKVLERTVACVEVKVGAPFPIARSTQNTFDALVPAMHAELVSEGGDGRILRISRTPLTAYHKRIAGSDFRQGDTIVEHGTVIVPKHVMALASVGVREVAVNRLLRVGVITTGSELASTILSQQSTQFKVPDANGPYITAALSEMGDDAVYLGALPEDDQVIATFVQDKLRDEALDVLIVTGGVTSGDSATVSSLANNLGATVQFQHLAMQPGSSALFATLPEAESEEPLSLQRGFYGSAHSTPSSFVTPPKTPAVPRRRRTALFGLPGSPIASAACFRFLVTPYLRSLNGMPLEREISAKVALMPEAVGMVQAVTHQAPQDLVIEGSNDYDIFRHAVVRSHHEGVSVEVSRERDRSKTSPFASSNCWVHIPCGHTGVRAGEVANIYPFCSPKS